jgi:AcrR family transcriptional regulator
VSARANSARSGSRPRSAAPTDSHPTVPGAPHASEKLRDAARSRRLILDAAEALFSERGFDGVGLREIAAAAGLSRQTPGYLFGSKEKLYRAVLERVSADRQDATRKAMSPLHAWCELGGDRLALKDALAESLQSYMRFFLARPSFARFISWEELAGAARLRSARRQATALTDAFTAIRRVAKRRGLRHFTVDDAVLLWIALGYAPIANQATVKLALSRDLSDTRTRGRHVAFAVDQMFFLLAGAED